MELSGKNKAVTRETIYPYIVPEPYVERLDRGPDGFIPWIGHDVYVLLVDDMRGVCRNIRMDELYALNLNVEFAHQLAIQNLQALARSGQIQKACCHAPMDRRFIVWGDHWLAASCLRLPGLGDWARKTLEADEVCASIPQREALFLFPMADRPFRDAMREIIRKGEEHARKQVTWDLFKFEGDRVCAFTESP